MPYFSASAAAPQPPLQPSSTHMTSTPPQPEAQPPAPGTPSPASIFTSTYAVHLPCSAQRAYDACSRLARLEKFMLLHPAAYSFDVLKQESVLLSEKWIARVLSDADAARAVETPPLRDRGESFDENAEGIPAIRLRFHLVERERVAGTMGMLVREVDSQGEMFLVPSRRLHVTAVSGGVGGGKCLKVRRFEDGKEKGEGSSSGSGKENEGAKESARVEERMAARPAAAGVWKARTHKAWVKAQKAHMDRYHLILS